MRISELAAASGVPIPTIKFYLREGLLPPGTSTAPRQAAYATSHVDRLRLIRVLTEVGGLRLATVRDVLSAIDDEQLPLVDLIAGAHDALAAARHRAADGARLARARRQVDRLVAQRRWRTRQDAPARDALAEVLASLEAYGQSDPASMLGIYADAADRIASREVASLPQPGDRAATVESVVVGTVLFESAFAALRRLAQEHHTRRRLRG